jgi:hypothetical protein
MFVLLRIVRAFFGVVFASEILYIIEAVAYLFMSLGTPAFVMGKFLALLVIKLLTLIGSGFAFMYLRKLINTLHEKKHGEPHPSLATKKWNL